MNAFCIHFLLFICSRLFRYPHLMLRWSSSLDGSTWMDCMRIGLPFRRRSLILAIGIYSSLQAQPYFRLSFLSDETRTGKRCSRRLCIYPARGGDMSVSPEKAKTKPKQKIHDRSARQVLASCHSTISVINFNHGKMNFFSPYLSEHVVDDHINMRFMISSRLTESCFFIFPVGGVPPVSEKSL